MRILFRIIFTSLCLCSIAVTAADPALPDDSPEAVAKELDTVERILDQPHKPIDKLDYYLTRLPGYRSWVLACIADATEQFDEADKRLAVLGETIAGESQEIAKNRQSLQQEKQSLETRLAACRVIQLRSEEMLGKINKVKQDLLTEELLAKSPDVLTLLAGDWSPASAWLDTTKRFIVENSGLDTFDVLHLFVFFLILGVAVGVGVMAGKVLAKLSTKLEAHQSSAHRFAQAFLITTRRYLPYMLLSLSAALFFYITTYGTSPIPFISIVAYGLLVVCVFSATIDLFLSASIKTQYINTLKPEVARALKRRLHFLLLLLFIGYLIFSTILAQSLPESALLLSRAVFGLILIINLIWVTWITGKIWAVAGNFAFRLISLSLLFGALCAEWLGYRNLSAYILTVVVGTILSVGAYILVSSLARGVLDSVDQGQGKWQSQLHTLLGIRKDQPIPGLAWIRFLVTLSLFTALVFSLLTLWRVPESYTQNILVYVTDGFSIGSFSVNPISIVQGVLVFAILLTILSWLRKQLEYRWLTKTRIERSTRESITTISGYVGVALAILISLSVAGMDFTKLAIIAGALSVGIGFGLQNIVNNFVSGLILLFERPIKTGDWIIVGDTEGYVKKISIRSTQIQTFDRADVIVPNSELISGKVTNWMLYDVRGRVRIPIGVAYGSDTALVAKLLLQIANEHPEVIKKSTLVSEPKVVFLSFGDSSLNFELRCYVRNIDKRIDVISDINYAIDAAFRQNNVEIPFPQRVVHLQQATDNPEPAS